MPKKKGTPTTEREQMILSGLFARTNMGQPMPKDIDWMLDRLYSCKHMSVEEATNTFCGEFMESEEIENGFYEEAHGWYKHTFKKKKYTREEIVRVWPEKAVVFRDMEKT